MICFFRQVAFVVWNGYVCLVSYIVYGRECLCGSYNILYLFSISLIDKLVVHIVLKNYTAPLLYYVDSFYGTYSCCFLSCFFIVLLFLEYVYSNLLGLRVLIVLTNYTVSLKSKPAYEILFIYCMINLFCLIAVQFFYG